MPLLHISILCAFTRTRLSLSSCNICVSQHIGCCLGKAENTESARLFCLTSLYQSGRCAFCKSDALHSMREGTLFTLSLLHSQALTALFGVISRIVRYLGDNLRENFINKASCSGALGEENYAQISVRVLCSSIGRKQW